MTLIDFIKAAGLAVLVLASNLLLTVLAVFIYSLAIEPGHPAAYYNAMAPRIGAWTGPAGGVLLMLLAAYVFGRRRPARNALAFAAAVFVFYVLLDVGSGLAMAPASEILQLRLGLSLVAAGLAGQAGGWLAMRRRSATT